MRETPELTDLERALYVEAILAGDTDWLERHVRTQALVRELCREAYKPRRLFENEQVLPMRSHDKNPEEIPFKADASREAPAKVCYSCRASTGRHVLG